MSMSEEECMDWKYKLDVKGYLSVIKQLKVKISRACINIRQYDKNWPQYHQNRLVKTNQLGCILNSILITIP